MPSFGDNQGLEFGDLRGVVHLEAVRVGLGHRVDADEARSRSKTLAWASAPGNAQGAAIWMRMRFLFKQAIIPPFRRLFWTKNGSSVVPMLSISTSLMSPPEDADGLR